MDEQINCSKLTLVGLCISQILHRKMVEEGKMEWQKKWSQVSDSPLCETQFSLLLLFYLVSLCGPCLSGGREIGLLCLD